MNNLRKPFFSHKVCLLPFEYIDIQNQKDGSVNCYACCPTLIPKSVGDLKTQTLDEIWTGSEFNEIRQTIIDGTYDYCNIEMCPEIQSNRLIELKFTRDHQFYIAKIKGLKFFKGSPKIINLSFDRTCNLACPSCRSDFITQNSDEEENLIGKITDELLSRDLSHTTLIACSSGDPFVSKHFRRLLVTLDGKKYLELKIHIMTNGLLFNRQIWESMHKIHLNISKVCVSIDAGNEATYNITRKGGSWSVLMKNLEFLSMLRSRNEIIFLRLDFVVQDHNYEEMLDFIKLGKKFKVDEVFFQKVANWGYFTEEEFKERAIYKEEHKDYLKFKEILLSPEFLDPFVNIGNLGHFVPNKRYPKKFNFINAILHSLINLKYSKFDFLSRFGKKIEKMTAVTSKDILK